MKKISSFLVLFLALILAFGNTKITSVKSQNKSDSVVAYFPFDGDANDATGNNHHGSVSGATLTTDRFGKTNSAYIFNGSSDYIDIAQASSLNLPEYTYSAWINPGAYPPGENLQNASGTILDIGGKSVDQYLYVVNYNPYYGISGSGYYTGGGSYDARTGILPNLNQWYHVVVTRSNTSFKLFVDGLLIQTVPLTAAGADYGVSPLAVIGKRIGDLQYFTGKIDDIKIYNNPLTDHRVQSLFHSESTGQVAYFPFNGNANDESGNGHNGSVSGATNTTDRFNQPGKAYNFVYNGFSSDRIEVSGTSDLNFSSGGFSLSAWVQFSGLATGGYNYPIFSKHICGEQSGYILMLYNGKLTFWLAGSGAYNVVSTPENYTDNSWHQVVAVYDGATQYIYVDGVLKNSIPFIYNSFNTANWALGGYNGCNGGFYGNVDEIKVFNKALTGTEIQNMYNKSAKDILVFLPFNGNANDESGNGYDGSVNGGILTEDRNNNQNSAYTFPNVHDQIVLANTINLNLQGGFTLNAWVKYKSTGSSIVTKHNCWTPNGFVLQIDNGQIRLAISNGDWFFIRTNEVFVEDKWYMVTGVFDSVNGIGSVYIDGHLKASGSAEYNNFNTASITISEALNGCPYGNMPGAIDEVKIYNKPLTTDEILAEYYASQTGLVAFYPFSGSANDASGNQNNGVVNNAVLSSDRYGVSDKAYSFNGIDSYIEGTNPGNNLPTGNSSRSFVAWVKDYTYQYWGSNIFHYGTAQSAPTNFHFLITDVLGLGNGYGYGVTYGKVNLIDSTWHFVCGTYTSTDQTVKLYVDGKFDKAEVLPTPPNTVLATNWKIGLFMAGGTPLNGKLDEIRVLNNVLSDQDIQNMYLNQTTAPVLQQPTNQSNNATLAPTLQWNSIFQNAYFRYQIANDSLFTKIILDAVTQNEETSLTEGLLSEGINYYWRVRTSLNGETGPWSDVWKFSTLNTWLNRQIQTTDLLSVSPNPAGSMFKISYTVPETYIGKSSATLEILNTLGSATLTILDERMSPGAYNITLSTENLKPGIYYCRLKMANQTVVRKLVITN